MGLNNFSKDTSFYVVIIFIAIFGIISTIILFCAQVNFLDDNSHYMNLGKSLYTGQGYRRIDIPGGNIEDTVAPGLPAFYSFLMSIRNNPKDLIIFKLLSSFSMWLYMIVMAYIAYKYLRINKWAVLGISVFFFANPRIMWFASMGSTEAPFMLFCVLSVLTLFEFNRRGKKIYFWLSLSLTIIALYVKITALPFLFAIVLWFLINKNYKNTSIFAGTVILAIALWLVPTFIFAGFRYTSQILPTSKEKQQNEHAVVAKKQQHVATPENIDKKSSVIAKNDGNQAESLKKIITTYKNRIFYRIRYYFFKFIPDIFFPVLWSLMFRNEPTIYGYLVGSILLLLIILSLFSRRNDRYVQFFGVFVFVYIGLYTLMSSNSQRYVIVLSGVLLLLYIVGFDYLFKLLRIRGRLLSLLSLLLFVIPILALYEPYKSIARYAHDTRNESNYVVRTRGSRYSLEPNIARYFDALEWCRKNTPEDAVILTPQVRSAYFISDRVSIRSNDVIKSYSGKGVPAYIRFWKGCLINNVSYILVDQVFEDTYSSVVKFVMQYLDCVEEVYQTPPPSTSIYKLDRECIEYNIENNVFEKIEEKTMMISRLMVSERYDEIADYAKNYEGDEKELERFMNYISFKSSTNKVEYAETLMYVASVLYPKNPELWNIWGVTLGRIYSRNKDLTEKAIIAFERALSYGADTSKTMNNIGVIYQNLGEYNRAADYFKRAVAADPEDFIMFSNLTQALAYAGRFEEMDHLIAAELNNKNHNDEFIQSLRTLQKITSGQY